MYRDAMKSLATILLLLAALTAGAAPKKPSKMDDALLQLQRAKTAAETLPALTYILGHAAEAPSLQLFIGATAAMSNNRLQDAAFLFYVAQMRSRYDLVRFPPKGTGGDSPTALLAALNQQIGAAVNPAIMRDPAALTAVVKRVEAWSPTTPPGYEPGWPHTAGKQDAAKTLFTSQRAAFKKHFGAISALLNDPAYFAAFKTVQDYNFSTAEQMKDPRRKKAKADAEGKMLAIERNRNIEGLYYKRP